MAWFTFTDASAETFVIRLLDPTAIDHARALLAGATTADARIGGTVVKTASPWNIGWSYHLEPDSIFFFEMSTEVGDSTMRYIEDHLEEIGGELLPGSVWTGWSSTLLDELDVRRGAESADELVGTAGADLLLARAGDDRLFGETGADHLVAGLGADRACGGSGNDKIAGGAGHDVMGGGDGRDILLGEAGDDQLNGGAGDDVLYGGGVASMATSPGWGDGEAALEGGDDRLVGGAGDDILWGDGTSVTTTTDETGAVVEGTTVLVGGADAFVFRVGYGWDRIEDFRSGDGDRIQLAGTGLTWGHLDNDGSGTLDEADDGVIGGADLLLDIGSIAGGEPGEDVLTLAAVTSLSEADFVFA